MGTFFFLKDKLEPTLVTHYVKLQGCRPPAEKVSALDGLATHATCPGTGKTEGGDRSEIVYKPMEILRLL